MVVEAECWIGSCPKVKACVMANTTIDLARDASSLLSAFSTCVLLACEGLAGNASVVETARNARAVVTDMNTRREPYEP